MSESNLPPEQWRPLFDRAGIEFGYRPLAARAGLTHTRVHRLVRGGGTTEDAIQAVADALGVKASKVRELRNDPAVDYEPFTLPDDAGRLTHDERDVIRSVVRALLDARGEQDVVEADPPAGTPDEAPEVEEAERLFTVLRFDPQYPETISQDSIAALDAEDARRRLLRGLELAGVPIDPSSDGLITVVRRGDATTLIGIARQDDPEREDRVIANLRERAGELASSNQSKSGSAAGLVDPIGDEIIASADPEVDDRDDSGEQAG